MLAFKTILHPTDFSDSSRFALELACSLAADYGSHLVIIHVMAAPLGGEDGAFRMAAPAAGPSSHAEPEVDGSRFSKRDQGVDRLRARLNEMDIPNDGIDLILRVEEGNPAAEILNMAQLCRADLIVMGSHGRGGPYRWPIGNVAEAVMRQATCPVLTVTAHSRAQTPRGSRTAIQATDG